MIGERPQAHATRFRQLRDGSRGQLPVGDSGVTVEIGVHWMREKDERPFYCNAVKSSGGAACLAAARMRARYALRSGAERLDEARDLFRLVVVHHVPRPVDDPFTPVGKRLETLLE